MEPKDFLRDTKGFHQTVDSLARLLDFSSPIRSEVPYYLELFGTLKPKDMAWIRTETYLRGDGDQIVASTNHLGRDTIKEGCYITSEIQTNFQIGLDDRIVDSEKAMFMGAETRFVPAFDGLQFFHYIFTDRLTGAHKKGLLPTNGLWFYPDIYLLAEIAKNYIGRRSPNVKALYIALGTD
ncbi:MAG: hypothetical protein V1837_03880 [Candidatus Woesearchaeota archaeon]